MTKLSRIFHLDVRFLSLIGALIITAFLPIGIYMVGHVSTNISPRAVDNSAQTSIPTCIATSSATLIQQTAPYTHRFQGSGSGDGIIGSRWDFDNDGTWDDETIERIWIDHTFTQAGTFWPSYQIRDYNGWSSTCNAPEKVAINPGEPSTAPIPNLYDMNDDGIINLVDYDIFVTGFSGAVLNP